MGSRWTGGRWVGALTLAVGVFFFCLVGLRLLPTRRSWVGVEVQELDEMMPIGWLSGSIIAVVLLLLALTLRRYPQLTRPRAVSRTLLFLTICLASAFLAQPGMVGVILGLSLVGAVLIGGLLPNWRVSVSDRRAALGLWLALFGVHAAISLYRHSVFGTSSWDMAIFIQDIHLASRGMPMMSTILGDVSILGSHFMPGLYLYAPLGWLPQSGYALLLLQAAHLGAIGPAIFGIARHHKVKPGAAIALALCAGLSFGVQWAVIFDVHEITISFGFFALAVWAFETQRFRLATASMLVFMLFKESLGAYLVALGLLALWRAIRQQRGRRRHLRYGAAWILIGATYFLVVNLLLMPWLLAQGNPLFAVAFDDFGPNMPAALAAMIATPSKAIGAFFVPGDKMGSWLATFGGSGWLALLSPQIAIAALPLFAERFLVSTINLWSMLFHYSASLSLYSFWAVARSWRKAQVYARVGLRRLGGPALAAQSSGVLILYLIASGLLVDGYGYRRPSGYMAAPRRSKPAQVPTHRAVIQRLLTRGEGARIAAQDYLMPHVAQRLYIYGLERWEKADWVILSTAPDEAPTNYEQRIRPLARRLMADAGWRLVEARGASVLFMRVGTADWAAVQPSPQLIEMLR